MDDVSKISIDILAMAINLKDDFKKFILKKTRKRYMVNIYSIQHMYK